MGEKLSDYVRRYGWKNGVPCNISVVGGVWCRHLPVIVLLVTGGTTKIALSVICLQSVNIYKYNLNINRLPRIH